MVAVARWGIILLLLFSSYGGNKASAAQPETEWEELILEEELDFSEIEESLSALTDFEPFSFGSLVKKMLSGELSLNAEKIWQEVKDVFFGELRQQKNLAVQILLFALVAAVFTNFTRIFESSQIAQISFFMLYLLISVLLMCSFSAMAELTARTLDMLNKFVRALLPAYLVTVVFSAGSVTAVGFYEVSLLLIHILETVVIKMILPLVQLYPVLLILNQLTREDTFTRLAGLLKTVADWAVKTILGITVGLQAVQCLVAPAVDTLKSSAAHRVAKSLPGVGNVLDAAAETVAGSAVVIKNAVGAAGILAIAAICIPPLIKLAASILLFKLLCALLEPISEKRMVDCIDSISQGASQLFRILLSGMAVFVISLAMITASVRGG